MLFCLQDIYPDLFLIKIQINRPLRIEHDKCPNMIRGNYYSMWQYRTENRFVEMGNLKFMTIYLVVPPEHHMFVEKWRPQLRFPNFTTFDISNRNQMLNKHDQF